MVTYEKVHRRNGQSPLGHEEEGDQEIPFDLDAQRPSVREQVLGVCQLQIIDFFSFETNRIHQKCLSEPQNHLKIEIFQVLSLKKFFKQKSKSAHQFGVILFGIELGLHVCQKENGLHAAARVDVVRRLGQTHVHHNEDQPDGQVVEWEDALNSRFLVKSIFLQHQILCNKHLKDQYYSNFLNCFKIIPWLFDNRRSAKPVDPKP